MRDAKGFRPRQLNDSPICASAPERETLRRASIDAHDAHMMRILQSDGRISNADLAQAVGLSPAATSERLRRLQDEGFVLGFEAVLNPEKLNQGMLAFAEVSLQYGGVALDLAFKSAVHARHEITECHEITGDFDYLIKARVPDLAAYRELISSVIWSLPAVSHVRTFVVLEEIKGSARLPI
jgi:Lrp/AsnC family leucine-responsive transcriptional regulator